MPVPGATKDVAAARMLPPSSCHQDEGRCQGGLHHREPGPRGGCSQAERLGDRCQDVAAKQLSPRMLAGRMRLSSHY